ncbi:MAG TPA: tripartite tricarboxylate transporter substrate binding protein [Xanthobacteraceae bacterium]|nr:tripartite tricarboxylate transporter substrate binding protein [Xanthobacteraceae bacterium]
MRHFARSLLAFTTVATLLAAGAVAPRAETYPARPIRFINPFPAGGPSDLVNRLYAQRLSQDWNQSAVVENRAGATGSIGTEAVVKATPDGYTLLFTVDLPIVMAPALMTLPYDPRHDLIAIAAVIDAENVLAVSPSAGIHSLAELVAVAKAKPGTLTFSSAGNGSPAHLCGEMIKYQTGIDMIHVPFTGAAPAMNALLAGNVTMFCGPIALATPYIKAGKVLALGVSGKTPSPLLPGVAPLSASYPGLTITNWYGVMAPKETPAPVVDKIRDEFKRIFDDPELQAKLETLGLRPSWLTGPDLAQRIADDIAKWRDFVTTTKIKAE